MRAIVRSPRLFAFRSSCAARPRESRKYDEFTRMTPTRGTVPARKAARRRRETFHER